MAKSMKERERGEIEKQSHEKKRKRREKMENEARKR